MPDASRVKWAVRLRHDHSLWELPEGGYGWDEPTKWEWCWKVPGGLARRLFQVVKAEGWSNVYEVYRDGKLVAERDLVESEDDHFRLVAEESLEERLAEEPLWGEG